jgi:mevalonate pyrophosphate decarboxylase
MSHNYETTEYAMLTLTQDNTCYSTTVIPSKKARQIISENKMKEKINNRHGRVWELPRKSFKRRFKGKYIINDTDL